MFNVYNFKGGTLPRYRPNCAFEAIRTEIEGKDIDLCCNYSEFQQNSGWENICTKNNNFSLQNLILDGSLLLGNKVFFLNDFF